MVEIEIGEYRINYYATHNKCDDCGATCERPDNCYTPECAKDAALHGKRLDYIMYKSGRRKAKLVHCAVRMNQIPGEKPINYSDHIGVYAEFSISDQHHPVFFCFNMLLFNLWKSVVCMFQTAIFRFLVALIIAFCLWHGLIGLTMEMKALKASKASIGMLLND
ncbi:unnamed protein product [Gongylonema pulchrum]|uniref:Endo/exonuclease/phosphatase domain-containing protein n=1 Tax=Gongylonema pulchrum TaxID=637853 RepID=A0A183E8J0_9BILA|nr:unnamed protein product [Gongylonema pulchrum]